jgi:hypothetical protein
MQEILFIDLLKNYTDYDFHDAHIKTIEYDYDEKYMQFNIKHYRELGDDDEIEVESILVFYAVDDVVLEDFSDSGYVSLFFSNPGISSFDEKIINQKKTYEIVARRWHLSFSAKKIKYREVKNLISE